LLPKHDLKEEQADLIRRARSGDEGAFEVLYREEVGRVYALCRRMARDAREAERLTQDTFVRAWQALGQFKGDSRFSTWLFRIAVNVVLASRRSDARLGAHVSSEAPSLGVARPAYEDRMDLDAAIRALPDRARAVLVLHDVEGYRHVEIGEMLGIATGTSKAHLHRARQLLREMLR